MFHTVYVRGLTGGMIRHALSLSLLLCASVSAAAADLDTAAARLIRGLQQYAGPPITQIRLSPVDIAEAGSRSVLPFSAHLRDRLGVALERRGFKVHASGAFDSAFWLLRARWQRRGDDLTITYLAAPWRDGQRGTVQAFPARVSAASLDASLFKPTPETLGQTLVHRLSLNEHLRARSAVNLRPLSIDGAVSSSELNRYLTDWLRRSVEASNLLENIDLKNSLASLPRKTLRTRGLKAIRKKGLSLAANLGAARNELMAVATREIGGLKVNARLLGEQGDELSQATVLLPLAMLPEAARTPDGAPGDAQAAAPAVSRGGLEVEIATNHGDGVATFAEGESINFLTRTNRRAFVYLFAVNSDKQLALIYPAFDSPHKPVPANELFILPDDGLPYDIRVVPPFGQDLVWALAVERQIEIPRTLTEAWADAREAMPRIRKLARAAGSYAEAQLIVQTRAR